jgi:hypothetical protein
VSAGATVLSPVSDGGVAAAVPLDGGAARVTVVMGTDGKTLPDVEVEGLELVSTDGQPVPMVGAALAVPTAKNGPKYESRPCAKVFHLLYSCCFVLQGSQASLGCSERDPSLSLNNGRHGKYQ